MQNEKTVTFGSVFGNFKWSASATLTDAMIDILLPLGALQVAQRTPSSLAEKLIAGYDKRPKGFQRNSLGFSEKAASVLKAQLESFEIADGVVLKCDSVEVVEYVPETAVPKYAEVKAMLALRESTEKWPTFLAALGFNEETSHVDGEYNPALCEALAARLRKVREDAAKKELDSLG